ncbi:hypothetical protein BX616_005344 [Lobosporangium transversale]|uniref:K Homology domain-containing protein n=1 Tax=Lobosporangium transversale TaxID=64571 RepID=A0A1Y2GKE7_9FUNG|nr:hypothetical protein BCR41DRAFT_356543 [Lobosporangium transversale]KAF9915791.1 hypothetical protein BX616_005344 [Lobosporangium transversale]ORZ12137.1 hypothetical protein BCR41DRAFT_356543 [Lobosporangium transversale]|eukprot:XP_021880002.1 hypothetical protein BCR41DRAFT_356543 [Lobosporangium transversale]
MRSLDPFTLTYYSHKNIRDALLALNSAPRVSHSVATSSRALADNLAPSIPRQEEYLDTEFSSTPASVLSNNGEDERYSSNYIHTHQQSEHGRGRISSIEASNNFGHFNIQATSHQGHVDDYNIGSRGPQLQRDGAIQDGRAPSWRFTGSEWPTLQASMESATNPKRSQHQSTSPHDSPTDRASINSIVPSISLNNISVHANGFATAETASEPDNEGLVVMDSGKLDEMTFTLDNVTLNSSLTGSFSVQHPASPPASPLLDSAKASDIADYELSRTLDRWKPSHGGGMISFEKGSSICQIEPEDEALVYEDPIQSYDKPDDSLHGYHSREYFQLAGDNMPLIHFRLVFSAYQIPRGTEFAALVGPIRSQFVVDTYMIPHESKSVHENQDIVLGISGSTGRVYKAALEFLRKIVPRSGGFTLWKLCILVPSQMVSALFPPLENMATNHSDQLQQESSIPELKSAMTRNFGPVFRASQECLITMESCSLDKTIGSALRYVMRALSEVDVSQDICEGYYRGGRAGRRSIIPKNMAVTWDHRGTGSIMDSKVPVGYVLRPEMQSCLKAMHTKRYHLQLLLTMEQVRLMAGEHGSNIRRYCSSKDVTLSISDPLVKEQDEIRVCDIGGDQAEIFSLAIAVVVSVLARIAQSDWSAKVYIPHRSISILQRQVSRGFHQKIHAVENLVRDKEIKLEPAERESILEIICDSDENDDNMMKSLRQALVSVVDAIYG